MFDLKGIAKACGSASKTKRGYRCLCPSHADRAPSLEISEGHDALLVHCYAGCKPTAILDALEKKKLKVRPKQDDKDRSDSEIKESPPKTDQAERESRIEWALKLWHDAAPAEGTLAEDYLRSRYLSLGLITKPHRVIRFHRACPRGEAAGGAKGLRQPAMICLMREIESDRPVAVHRRYLKPDGLKDGKPFTLGPSFGAAVKLSDQRDVFGDEFGTCDLLHVTEGVESALAALAFGYRPCWALGSAGNLNAFPVLFAVGELTVLADFDRRGWGQRAAQGVIARWHTASKRASAWVGRDGGDLADTWERAMRNE